MTTDNDEFERHDAHYRVNPKGHRELVIKRKGEQDDETLNELADQLMATIDPRCPGCNLPYIGAAPYCGNCRARVGTESIDFAGPLPDGGPAGSPEQEQYQRRRNQPEAPGVDMRPSDIEREHGESPNNMTASTPQASDGPERSRAKSNLKANARGSGFPNKYITGYRGDGLDYGATHNESFTGTGAIAIAPAVATVDDDEEDDNEDSTLESVMNRSVINEWEPKFAGGGDYSPSDYQMPSPTGDGVAERKPKKDKVGKYDTDTSQEGEAWPRKHNDTAAMCDVDEDGVEHKPQGSHESSVGDPDDGHQTEIGHNWPDEAKNSGSGVAEPFEGNRWSDGGTLSGGSAQDEMDNKGRKQSMPSDGPITGTSGPQLGQPQESWSPDTIGALMEGDDVNVQGLFDAYAKQTDYVCLEDFQQLLTAHGSDAILDEGSLLRLMDVNNQLVFHEGLDASGRYWVGVPFEESQGKKPWENDDKDDDDCDDDDCNMSEAKVCDKCGCDPCECEDCMEESRRSRRRRTLNEFQVRSPDDEAKPYGVMGPDGRRPMGDPDFDDPFGVVNDVSDDMGANSYADMLDISKQTDAIHGSGPYDACPECGAPDTGEEACPECGTPMGDSEESMFGGSEDDIESVDLDLDWDSGARMESVRSPRMMKGLSNFMKSARNIIDRNRNDFKPGPIAEALQYAWNFHAGGVDPRQAPSKVRASIKKLMESYPQFNPLVENDAMDRADGTAIASQGGASNSSGFLSEKDNPGPDEMKDHGDPLGSKQKNNLDGTPTISGTEKGMTGKGNYAKSVKENVSRLASHTKRHLIEHAKGLGKKYGMAFTVLVQEGKNLNRTSRRDTLAEALADVEEILQVHSHQNIVLEAYFIKGGKLARKADIPMIAVKPRGPLVSEGKALFRFQRTAEKFADELVTEGATCRLGRHNWGHAVSAKVNYKTATRAFRSLEENKDQQKDPSSDVRCPSCGWVDQPDNGRCYECGAILR